MSYTLEEFCSTLSRDLKTLALQEAIENGARNLSKLIGNDDFVASAFGPDMPPKRLLYHDADTDFYVFAHLQKEGKHGAPHSHGASWAIYGNAMTFTDMTEYRRVNSPDEEATILEVSDRYRLRKGMTRAYGPHLIHSTSHPERAWVVRITGTNLDVLPRYRFKKDRDRLIEA
jgi:hypothetical protein